MKYFGLDFVLNRYDQQYEWDHLRVEAANQATILYTGDFWADDMFCQEVFFFSPQTRSAQFLGLRQGKKQTTKFCYQHQDKLFRITDYGRVYRFDLRAKKEGTVDKLPPVKKVTSDRNNLYALAHNHELLLKKPQCPFYSVEAPQFVHKMFPRKNGVVVFGNDKASWVDLNGLVSRQIDLETNAAVAYATDWNTVYFVVRNDEDQIFDIETFQRQTYPDEQHTVQHIQRNVGTAGFLIADNKGAVHHVSKSVNKKFVQMDNPIISMRLTKGCQAFIDQQHNVLMRFYS